MQIAESLQLPVELAPERALATYGKTFHWASALLGGRAARDARTFYAFCRYADDLADEVGEAAGRGRLRSVRADLAAGRSSHPVVAEFLTMAAGRSSTLGPARALVDALERDVEPSRLETVDELIRFAYGVAGTVGLVMCDLFGAREARARPFAIDLGVAMQLTNVARDVLEDAERGRRYLPTELLGRDVDPRDVARDGWGARRLAHGATLQLLELADVYYRSAERGMRYLPARARAAALVASRCYEAIGNEIRARGPRFWDERCFVGKPAKLRLTARALRDLVLDPTLRGDGPAPVHDAELHLALAGLPGADPAAR